MAKMYISAIVLAAGIFFLFPKETLHASVGFVEMRPTNNESFRCHASSYIMQNGEYRILFNCLNLIYPADENLFNYVMWATPIGGKAALKLGLIGLGRGEFKTRTPFSQLFITTEKSKDTKTPQGRVVMRGNITPIEFLEEAEEETSLTPAPTSGEEQISQAPEEKPLESLTTREKFSLALRRAGIAALVALVALIGLVFVITRSRG